MIRPGRPLHRNAPRTGLDNGPTNRLTTQDSGSPNPRHLSRKGHLFFARQTITAARSITNLALQTRPPRSAPSANNGHLPFTDLRLDHSGSAQTHVMVESHPRTDTKGHLTQWGTQDRPAKGHLRNAKTGPQRVRPVISKEGQHLGDRALAVPTCDKA